MLPLTIWMNMPSFHQDDLFTRLADSGEVDLRVVFAKEMTADRVEMGWTAGARRYRHHMLKSPFAVAEAFGLARRERDRLHIVNGIWAEPAFAAALTALNLSRSRFIIYSEGPDNPQRRTVPRRLLRGTFGQWVARRAAGILAISHFAGDFYRELGCADERLYPFGYFRARPDALRGAGETTDTTRTEIVFVGRLTLPKGVDVLLNAMRPLFTEYPGLHLTMIGDGREREPFAAQAAVHGLQDRLTFTGVLPAREVQSRVAQADLLVLPSRDDGWGMVINEALAVGVPVIASDVCGASDLIFHGVNGYVFRSEDHEGLRDCLRRFCNQSLEERRAMGRAALVTGESLDAGVAAGYLIACLKHMTGLVPDKPVAPWLAPSLLEAGR